MNKSFLAVAALGVMLATGYAWSSEDATSRCQGWAKEDGVAAEEMQEYMAQCLEEQRAAEAGADSQSDDKMPSDEGQSKD